VPARQQTRHAELDHVAFAEDDLLDVVNKPLD